MRIVDLCILILFVYSSYEISNKVRDKYNNIYETNTKFENKDKVDNE